VVPCPGIFITPNLVRQHALVTPGDDLVIVAGRHKVLPVHVRADVHVGRVGGAQFLDTAVVTGLNPVSNARSSLSPSRVLLYAGALPAAFVPALRWVSFQFGRLFQSLNPRLEHGRGGFQAVVFDLLRLSQITPFALGGGVKLHHPGDLLGAFRPKFYRFHLSLPQLHNLNSRCRAARRARARARSPSISAAPPLSSFCARARASALVWGYAGYVTTLTSNRSTSRSVRTSPKVRLFRPFVLPNVEPKTHLVHVAALHASSSRSAAH
jgi:hypothetical protein